MPWLEYWPLSIAVYNPREGDKMTGAGTGALKKTLGSVQYLALAVGCMIGIGWVTVLGEWLHRAGPWGAIAGFVIGGLIMMGVAACYAELSGMMPAVGGDIVFARAIFGAPAGFFVGWFLILIATAVASFEAISFVWVAETLLPDLGTTPLYRALGHDVSVQQLALGLSALVAMFFINAGGMSALANAQSGLTGIKLVLMLAFVAAGIFGGDISRVGSVPAGNTAPENGVLGALWIAGTCAFWLGGFQVISHAAGERSPKTSLRAVSWITVISVGIGLVFYMGVIVASSAAQPLEATINSALPAASAAEAVFKSKIGAVIVLTAGLAGIVATLNAMLMSGSRLSLALAKAGYLPTIFAKVDRRGVPMVALLAIAALAALGVLGGRGALIPAMEAASISLILSYLVVCLGTLRLRRRAAHTPRPFRAPLNRVGLWLLILAVAAMATSIVISSTLASPAWWVLSLLWITLGVGLWFGRPKTLAPDALGDSS